MPTTPAFEFGTPLSPSALRVLLLGSGELGKDVAIGAHMPGLFVQAGLGEPDGCDVHGRIQRAEGGGGMLRAVLCGLRNAALARGCADAATLDRIDAELSATPPGRYRVRWPDLVATWKRNSG